MKEVWPGPQPYKCHQFLFKQSAVQSGGVYSKSLVFPGASEGSFLRAEDACLQRSTCSPNRLLHCRGHCLGYFWKWPSSSKGSCYVWEEARYRARGWHAGPLDHFLSLLPKGCTIWARQMTYMGPTICTLYGSHHLYVGVMHTLF